MARPLTTAALNEINSVHSEAVWIWLLTIASPEIETVRVCNNNEDILSLGIPYLPYPFAIVLNTDDGDRFAQIQLTIENIDRAFVDLMITTQDALTLSLLLVDAKNPDSIEIEVPNMTLRNVSFDQDLLRGTLIIDDLLNSRYPRDTMDSAQYPGLY